MQATGHGAWTCSRPTLLVATGRLDEVTIDPRGSARVGAGVRWQQVLDAAAPHGLAGLAGSSPDVGVVGYLTGGGLGPVARSYGFASDYVTAFDVVTGDGELRRATAEENPALFWALRGGKGALGVVTAVEFDLVPLAEIFGGCLYFDRRRRRRRDARPGGTGRPTCRRRPRTSLAVLRLPGDADGAAAARGPDARSPCASPGPGEAATGPAGRSPRWSRWPRWCSAASACCPTPRSGSIHADPRGPDAGARAGDAAARAARTRRSTRCCRSPARTADCPQVIVELRRLGGALAREPQVPAAPSATGTRRTRC